MFENGDSTGCENEHGCGRDVEKLQAVAAGAANVEGRAFDSELWINATLEKCLYEASQFRDRFPAEAERTEEGCLGGVIDVGREKGAGGYRDLQRLKFPVEDKGFGEWRVQNYF
jgi:hypothetical protein